GPQVTVLDPQGVTLAVLGHPGFQFNDVENTFQLQQKLTANLGRHQVKVGGEFTSSDFSLTGGGNPDGSYLVQLNEAQLATLRGRASVDLRPEDIPGDVEVVNYGVELRPATFGERQNLLGLYVEDLIAVSPRLNVTLGLRYDYDSISRGGSDSGDFNNLAPRFNVNYALDERSSLRAGYGLFYEKVPYAIYSDALQQNSTAAGYRQQLQQLIDRGILPSDTDLDRITFDGNLTVNPENVTYLNGPTPATVQNLRANAFSGERRILNPEGYDNPYTHQFSVGYQRQLDPRTRFFVDLMHTRSYGLFRLRDLNAPTPFEITAEQANTLSPEQLRGLVRTPAEADATRPVAPVTGGARGIIVTETGGESRYYAASLNLERARQGTPYAYRLSYTLSELTNDTEDINFRAQNSNDFDDEWGPSINDRTHVLSGIFYYYPVNDLSISVATLLQSGQPINRIPDASIFGTSDLNGDGRSFGDAYVGNSDRQPGETRNSDRLPWSSTFDVGLQYILPLSGHDLALTADVFNVFNAENLSGYSNNATQSNQIQVGPASSGVLVRRNAAAPRQFQFGVRYLF
ncbi:MAG: TonB-dependent receptor, partial [Bacteroidota bacterium]